MRGCLKYVEIPARYRATQEPIYYHVTCFYAYCNMCCSKQLQTNRNGMHQSQLYDEVIYGQGQTERDTFFLRIDAVFKRRHFVVLNFQVCVFCM